MTTSAVPPGTGDLYSPVVRTPGAFETALSRSWAGHRTPVPAAVLTGAAVTAALGGWLLVGHDLGAGLAVVATAALVPAAVRLRSRPLDLATLALAATLTWTAALRDAEWAVALCVCVAAWLAVVAATGARTGTAHALVPATWAFGALRAVPWLRHAAGSLVGRRREQVLVSLRSVGVTVVLLLVFGALLAGADRVFASYLEVDLGRLPAQVVVGALAGLGTAVLAHLALAPPTWSGARLRRPRTAGRGEWLLPVLALDVLVLGFVLVQVAALVGGHDYVRRTAGLSYATYAREGFGQLLAVTALTLVVVTLAARRAPRRGRTDRLLTASALAVLCLATLGVVASALRRMDLYVDAFGLTRLRLFAVTVEVALAVVVLLVLVAGARWRGGWLPRAAALVAGAAMLTLTLANPDALIARHNLDPATEAPLDVDYLRGLSADAVPVLVADPDLRSCVLADPPAPPSSLPGWDLGSHRAAQAVADLGEPSPGSAAADCSALRSSAESYDGTRP